VGAIFSTQNDLTASPLGSLTAASPLLNPFEAHIWAEWLAARHTALPVHNGRSRKVIAQDQIPLF
jgi:hypothetical protein